MCRAGIAEGFAAGKQAKVPLLIGGNSNEASLFRPQPRPRSTPSPPARKAAALAAFDPEGKGNKPQIVNDMATRPVHHRARPQRSRACTPRPASRSSSTTSPTSRRRRRRATPCGAAHTDEIRFAFAGRAASSRPRTCRWPTAVNAYWAAFIKTGNPGRGRRHRLAEVRRPPTEASMEFGADGPKAREQHFLSQLDWSRGKRLTK